jgi:hypothetical protein
LDFEQVADYWITYFSIETTSAGRGAEKERVQCPGQHERVVDFRNGINPFGRKGKPFIEIVKKRSFELRVA